MGDMGDLYREWRPHKKRKKRSNSNSSTSKIRSSGFAYRELSPDGPHLRFRRSSDGSWIDFWCSTGTIIEMGKTSNARGVKALLGMLRSRGYDLREVVER